MIPKIISREFLDRPLDDHRWMKRLSDADLDKAIAELNPAPRFLNPPRGKHQKVCFLLGVAYLRFFFLLDMGTGKTWLSLMLLEYFLWTGAIKRALVVVPTEEVLWTWEEQVELHAPSLPVTYLTGPSEEKWRALRAVKKGLVVVTYPGLNHMVSSKVAVKKKGRKRNKLKPDKVKLAEMKAWVQACVMDESTEAANPQSLTHKVLDKITADIDICYALAGVPFGREPTPVWGQYYLVDRGETLGETLGLFREALYTKKRAYWHKGYEYKFDRKKEPTLNRMLNHRGIVYEESECGDIPEVVSVLKRVRFPEETEQYYKKVRDRVIASRGNYSEMQNAFLRWRQISSGFLGFRNDETGERAQVEFDHNPKLNLLLNLIEDMPRQRKGVIVHEFIWSGERICRALKEEFGWQEGRDYVWITGGQESRSRIQRFKTSPRCRFMLLNWRKGGYGLNLQVANYQFYYESPVSVIDRKQTDKRVARGGQTRRVWRYDLVVRDTADERILQFHAQGGDLFKSLMGDPRKVLNA